MPTLLGMIENSGNETGDVIWSVGRGTRFRVLLAVSFVWKAEFRVTLNLAGFWLNIISFRWNLMVMGFCRRYMDFD